MMCTCNKLDFPADFAILFLGCKMQFREINNRLAVIGFYAIYLANMKSMRSLIDNCRYKATITSKAITSINLTSHP